jgi:hypothetical protein
VFGRRFFAALTVASLAACGSASDAVTFAPPSNFHAKSSVGPLAQTWETDDRQSELVLLQLPVKADLDKILAGQGLNDASVRQRKMITICGNQPALYAHTVGTVGNVNVETTGNGNTRLSRGIVDMIGTNANGRTYVAIYARSIKTPLDAAAEDAIHKVCPK